MVTITEEKYNNIKEQVNTNERLRGTIKRINDMVKDENVIDTINQLDKVSWEQLM